MNETLKNKYSRIALMGLFVFLFHNAKLSNHVVGIDTEKLIYMKNEFYPGWLQNGRQGLVFFKWITDTLCFNPYFAGLFTLILLTISISGCVFVWERVYAKEDKKSIFPFAIAGLLWCSHPVLTEQLYFSLQSVEIAFGFGLSTLSVYLAWLSYKKKKWWYVIPSVAGAVLPFCMYQAFVPFYIFMVVTVLVLDLLRQINSVTVIKYREFVLQIAFFTGIFMVAFVCNAIVTKLFFSSSDYLESQMVWGSASVSQIVLNLWEHIKTVQLGRNSFYFTVYYSIWSLLFIGICVYCLFRFKKIKNNMFFYLAFLMVSLFATPYLMTFICGIAPAVRSQFIMPGMMAFLVYVIFELIVENIRKKEIVVVLGILAGITILAQAQVTLRLYYTEELRYRQDVYRANRMIEEIDKLQGQYPLPVAFVGELPFEGNSSCLKGETMGHSFFEHDAQVEPYSYYSSGRILGFMETLGKSYHLVHPEDFEKAWEYSYYMPEWPYENSVSRKENMIVIKLRYW